MSVTVMDLLYLPCLHEAKLIGGDGGLKKIVSAISVLEYTEKESFDDSVIMDLAKRRLNAKRNLIGQVIDFALMCSFMLILIESYSWGTRFLVAVTFCAFWGIRLLLRIFKFVKPSFKSGIAAYFWERREQSLESECSRLRKMSAEQVVGELNR